MRIFAILLVVVGLLAGTCQAMVPMTAGAAREALQYGQQKAAVPLAEFLRPWTVYEQDAVQLNEATEWVCVYTPYLLLAADARDKVSSGRPVRAEDTDKVLDEYADYRVIGVTLFGGEAGFAAQPKIALQQGKRSYKPKTTIVPAAEKTAWHTERQPGYVTRGYLYFGASEVSSALPAVLVVVTADHREHRFFLNLPQFR